MTYNTTGIVSEVYREQVSLNPAQTATISTQTSGSNTTSAITWSNVTGLYPGIQCVLTGGTASEAVQVVSISGSTVVYVGISTLGVIGGPAQYTDHTGATWGYGGSVPDNFLEGGVSPTTPTNPTRALGSAYLNQQTVRGWPGQLHKRNTQT